MTKEVREQIALELETKAAMVIEGAYGPAEPGEDESWSGDLRHAAFLLHEDRIDDLNQLEIDEIEALGHDVSLLRAGREVKCKST